MFARTFRSILRRPFLAVPGLPFSESVAAGDWLFLSGQIGTDASGALVPGGIAAETRQALANLRAALVRGGASLERVVKVTVMLADIAEWPAMNAEYLRFFPRHLPARSAFATAGLALGARVEIECIAWRG